VLGWETGADARMAIYVLAQGIGTPGVTSLGKIFSLVSNDGLGFFVCGAVFAAVGATNTGSSILAARRIDQSTFIPFASVCSLMLNQLTGLTLWGDWATIRDWVSYVGIHILVLLGIYIVSAAQAKGFEFTHHAREKTVQRLSATPRHQAARPEHSYYSDGGTSQLKFYRAQSAMPVLMQ